MTLLQFLEIFHHPFVFGDHFGSPQNIGEKETADSMTHLNTAYPVNEFRYGKLPLDDLHVISMAMVHGFARLPVDISLRSWYNSIGKNKKWQITDLGNMPILSNFQKDLENRTLTQIIHSTVSLKCIWKIHFPLWLRFRNLRNQPPVSWSCAFFVGEMLGLDPKLHQSAAFLECTHESSWCHSAWAAKSRNQTKTRPDG